MMVIIQMFYMHTHAINIVLCTLLHEHFYEIYYRRAHYNANNRLNYARNLHRLASLVCAPVLVRPLLLCLHSRRGAHYF